MNGYCEDCDKQIEFHKGTVINNGIVNGIMSVYLQCPWCEGLELITKVNIPTKK